MCIVVIELGIEKASEYNDYEYMFKGYDIMGKIYYKLDMRKELESTIKSAIDILENSNNLNLKIKYYSKLQELYFKNEEYDKAKKCLHVIQNLLKCVSFNGKICIEEVF